MVEGDVLEIAKQLHGVDRGERQCRDGTDRGERRVLPKSVGDQGRAVERGLPMHPVYEAWAQDDCDADEGYRASGLDAVRVDAYDSVFGVKQLAISNLVFTIKKLKDSFLSTFRLLNILRSWEASKLRRYPTYARR